MTGPESLFVSGRSTIRASITVDAFRKEEFVDPDFLDKIPQLMLEITLANNDEREVLLERFIRKFFLFILSTHQRGSGWFVESIQVDTPVERLYY